ncbi:class A sortase [Atopobacter sp. AH10]|uniref:class A sortase n=1 Tax=Atopobacter sp. AH10 TaxID=2315861 RepID=UPI001F475C5E|nr:class A sortase [Atopobacter sp. AH10]
MTSRNNRLPSRSARRRRGKNNTWNKCINVISFLLIVAGLAMLAAQPIKYYLIGRNQNKYALSHLTAKDLKENKNKVANFDFSTVENVDATGVIKNSLKGKPLPVIGGIAIPAVKLNLPIYKGVENAQLISGAGTLRPEQEMGKGNYPLASHRMKDESLLFTPLIHLQKGDLIYLTDLQYIYVYKTENLMEVEPTRTDLIEDDPNGAKQVTLITCNIDGSKREIAQGTYVKKVSMTKASPEMKKAFEIANNTVK